MKKLFIILLFLLFAVEQGWCTCPDGACYVDVDWTGTESGTQAEPYNTFTEAMSASITSDDIYVKAGTTVTGNYNLATAGTSLDPRIIGRYGMGVNPIFTGRLRLRSAYTAAGDYTILQDLSLNDSSDRGIEIGGFDNITIRRVAILSATSYGIEIRAESGPNYSDNVLIDDVTISNGDTYGIWGNAGTGCIVRNTTFDGNGTVIAANNCSLSPGANSSVLLFEDCISKNCPDGNGFGTSASGSSQTTIYRRCNVYNNAGGVIAHGSSATGKAKIEFCIINSITTNDGIMGGTASPVSVEIYNSTIMNAYHYGINFDNTGANIVENCIIDGNGEGVPASGLQIAWRASGSTLVSNYNCITEQSTGRTIYDKTSSTMYTLSGWQASNANAYDQNSIGDDPILRSDGKISNTSPAINKGTWIVGVNMEGQKDPWGKGVYEVPNIGADQGAGAPDGGGDNLYLGKEGIFLTKLKRPEPTLPFGYDSVIDKLGNYIVDESGNYVIVPNGS